MSSAPPFAQKAHESLTVRFYGAAGALLACESYSDGRVDRVTVPARRIVGLALRLDAYAIDLFHSHPGGDPAPSRADLQTTRQLAAALRPLGIALRDHVILAGDARFSFAQAGYL